MSKNIILIIGASSDIGIELIKEIEEDCLILAHCNSNKRLLEELSTKIDNKIEILRANLNSEKETIN